MFLRFNFVLLVVIFFAAGISPLRLQGNAWEGFSLGLCVMKYKNEGARCMARKGAALKRAKWKEQGRAKLEDELVANQLQKGLAGRELKGEKKITEELSFKFGGECCCFSNDG
jgi:hypothetical protein